MAIAFPSIQNFNTENSIKIMGNSCQQQLPSKLNLLVWNIYKASKPNWLADFSKLSADQDLIVLQEAVYNSKFDTLFENSDTHEWVMARSFKNRRNGIETGVKTGATSSCMTPTPLFSPNTEPLSGTPKIALSTCYKIKGSTKILMVLNVHAINFVSVKKYNRQLAQLEALTANHTGPTIIAGDFNTWSLSRVKQFEQFTHNCGLREAQMRRKTRITHLNSHLDHVYYRDLELSSIHSLDSISSSDHSPIQVKFTVPT